MPAMASTSSAPRVPLLAAVRIENNAQRAHGVAAQSVIHVHSAPIGVDETGATTLCQVELTVGLPQPARYPHPIYWRVGDQHPPHRPPLQRSLVYPQPHNQCVDESELFFGPTPPEGNEGQWIQTLPGKGWIVYFRIYGPEEAAFDNTWIPDDFVQVTQ
jgi:hypothetical protein